MNEWWKMGNENKMDKVSLVSLGGRMPIGIIVSFYQYHFFGHPPEHIQYTNTFPDFIL
jgi:hypothetical protein